MNFTPPNIASFFQDRSKLHRSINKINKSPRSFFFSTSNPACRQAGGKISTTTAKQKIDFDLFFSSLEQGSKTPTRVPIGLWKEKENRRQLFDKVLHQFSEKSQTLEKFWYDFSLRKIESLSLRKRRTLEAEPAPAALQQRILSFLMTVLKNYYSNTLFMALKDLYPQVEWRPWMFENGVYHGFWTEKENRKIFMDWAHLQLAASRRSEQASRDDFASIWYGASLKEIRALGGSAMISEYYESSLLKALKEIYPSVRWHPWNFSNMKVSPGFWSSPDNRRAYVQWIGEQLGVREPKDWYNISREQVLKIVANKQAPSPSSPGREASPNAGMAFFKKHYGTSLIKALIDLYPEYDLKPWLFQRCEMPKGFWENPANRRSYMEWVACRLDIREPRQWGGWNSDRIKQAAGSNTMLSYYNHSLRAALEDLYPEHGDVWKEKWIFFGQQLPPE